MADRPRMRPLFKLALPVPAFGLSQWNLGWTPWALAALPLCLVGAAWTWVASALGQRLAEPQMQQLQAFLEECVRRASDPPGLRPERP